MARGVRFLLGFRQYPFLKKTGPGIPVFGYCPNEKVLLEGYRKDFFLWPKRPLVETFFPPIFRRDLPRGACMHPSLIGVCLHSPPGRRENLPQKIVRGVCAFILRVYLCTWGILMHGIRYTSYFFLLVHHRKKQVVCS